MVSRNEGHVTGDGGQSWLEGVASGGWVQQSQGRRFGQSSVTSLHLDGRRVGCWSCDCGGGAELFRPAAFRTCLVGTAGGAVGRPQADGHQEGGDEAKHLHKTPQVMTSRMARNRK